MSEHTLYDTVWENHKVTELPNGQDQLFVGLHLIHEVTSPQAFAMLEEREHEVAFPDRNFATTDHIAPTEADKRERPLSDGESEEMLSALERNVSEHGITYFGFESGKQGITHVVAPELGLTQPGMTVACGDSHTATHGAFGSVGVGVGTSQIRDILATGCIAADKQQVARISRIWEVPTPTPTEPKAPWVAVCESPQATVIPGWVRPSSGATTCVMPCLPDSNPK